MVLRAIDLFAGAGGLSFGLQLAGIEVVGAVEWDKAAVQVYRHNLGDHIVEADITSFGPEKMETFIQSREGNSAIKPIDLVCGGPPCPGFSLIGRSKISNLIKTGKWHGSEWRHGFIDDPRNQLFLEFVKYVRHFTPRMFLMENVSGMFSSKTENGGPMIDLIMSEFKQLGYNVNVKLMSAASYGVPQDRKRVIFLGTRADTQPLFPMELPWKLTLADAIKDLPRIDINTGLAKSPKKTPLSKIQSGHGKQYLRWLRLLKTDGSMLKRNGKLSSHVTRKVNPRDQAVFPFLKSGEKEPRVLYKDIYPKMVKEIKQHLPEGYVMLKASDGHRVVHRSKKGRTRKWYDPSKFGDKMRRMRSDQPSPTLVAHLAKDGYMFVHPWEDRTITVREAARIQSFPDSFDFSAGGKVPFTQQFRQIGNAVAPQFALALGASIIQQLGQVPRRDISSIFLELKPSQLRE
jgi:DNA (cytosine-5)-methyltransferase 1